MKATNRLAVLLVTAAGSGLAALAAFAVPGAANLVLQEGW